MMCREMVPYFLPKERWEPLRESFFQRAGLPADPRDVPGYLTKRLNTAYDLFHVARGVYRQADQFVPNSLSPEGPMGSCLEFRSRP